MATQSGQRAIPPEGRQYTSKYYQLYAFLVCAHYNEHHEMIRQWWTYCVYPSTERNFWNGGPK